MGYQLTAGLDVAELALWAFFLFFLGLVVYLRREDHREGYPMEDDVGGRIATRSLLFDPSPKTFHLPFGQGSVQVPRANDRTGNMYKGRRTGSWNGAPSEPVGDPLLAGIGPGAYADRSDHPDMNMEGHPRIVPLRVQPDFFIAAKDPDPRGFTVVGADRVVAGTVSDIWIDTADRLVRYIEVALPSGKSVLAPMFMASVDRKRRAIEIDAVCGRQFDNAPATPVSNTISLNEEERVQAYFGAGYLFATPDRAEPFL
ncbi:photosynthetic reaction center subunit H [Glacieibacterium frigidum]|uniref:Photosynthetic reaction center subunit H n=1 Tax=Glacieibacterium frigidum TaxID=2593303 RepID=A0A552U9U5_9SPHN|nr:photosynthetic reaction center subunit H [Glacieibacterium frigidum]TRW14994.1 photosynthetic reaction center subunit H [Glacieibacterium frigidum]